MSDEPTREQPRIEPSDQPPVRLWAWVFLAAGVTGSGVFVAALSLAAGAPWPVPALAATSSVAGAIALRWYVMRARRTVCRAPYYLGGEAAWLCQRRAGHRLGAHREGPITWDDSGAYRWRGRRR